MVGSGVLTPCRSALFVQGAPRLAIDALRILGLSLLLAAGPGAASLGGLAAQERGGVEFARWDAAPVGQHAVALVGRPAVVPASLPTVSAPPADPLTLTMAGLAGSAVGVFAGGYLGYQIDRQSEDVCDYCGLTGLLLGAAVGSAVLTPLAVHAANGGRGDLSDVVVASSAITGIGMLLTVMTNSGEVLIAVPLAAIIASVATERATTP